MNVEILGVGSELLLGQIANTNAQYISQKLSELGLNVYYHSVVGDNHERLLKALEIAVSRSDIIITTGGLGPTMDDITKETVCDFLGLEISVHGPSLERIEAYFRQRNRPMTQNNVKQAMFPEKAKILPNDVGTAPGAIVEEKGKIFIILPGPPVELKPMFENYVIPYLESKSDVRICSKVLKIYGMGESVVEEKIKDILLHQSNPTIAPLAGNLEVTLRITARCPKNQDPYDLIGPVENQIRERLGDVVYGVDDDQLESVVAALLKEKKKNISTAESCTGGLIANLLTNVPGISENFIEGFVTYSNESKMSRLGVDKGTLEKYGAVSAETALEMARGLIQVTGSDIGLAVTGIAGPGGGSERKPVGLVYIAVATADKIQVQKYVFQGDRIRIKNASAKAALDWLRRILLEIH